MKNIIYLLLIFLLPLNGCKKFVSQDDVNPNQPTKASLATMLPVVEVAIFATYTGQITRTSGIWTQHFQGTGFQMIDIAKYSLSENDVQNDWTTIYNAGFTNVVELIALGESEKSPYYVGIGKILKSMLLGISTDYWGDVPNKEAGLGAANLSPKYETQQEVIANIQLLLDEAIVDLSKPKTDNSFLPGGDDFIGNGDAKKWIISAHILKARYANRLSDRDPSGSANSVLTNIDNAIAAGMTGNGDDANAIFSTNANEVNSFAAFDQQRSGYIKLHATLVDAMKARTDPRLPFYATKDANNGYSGTPTNNNDTVSTSSIGAYYASKDSPLPLITFVEAKFMEAEAANRAGNSVRAQSAFTDALTAALNRYPGISGTDVTNYIVANGTLAGTSEQNLEKIMYEKWISNFTQPEVFSDWRRTGLPALTPATNGVTQTIPRRFPTEQNERLYNKNAVVVSNTTDKVWWDN